MGWLLEEKETAVVRYVFCLVVCWSLLLVDLVIICVFSNIFKHFNTSMFYSLELNSVICTFFFV
uniref:Uncharacterized protein n=1 Tax=Anguilla anguilla TaxID=7936 RepID=A0A0E9W0Q7_ANGAN